VTRRRGPDRHQRKLERLPFDAIEAVVRSGIDGQVCSIEDIALRLHCNRREIYRWRVNGLTPERADRLAIHLGTHPALLWPHWCEVAA
jgi:hypothetical protein